MTSKLFTTSLLATAMFAGLGMAPAQAQGTPQVDQAQLAIGARIQQGLASGHITPSEAQVLYRRDRDVAAREAQYKANGRVSPEERQQLRSDVSVLAADVERMMANREVAARHGYPGHANTPGIDRQEYRISQRIDEGMRSGRITPSEARKLHNRERQFDRHEAAVRSDGVVTPRERRQLRNELAALRDDVERMLHNGRRRG